MQKLFLGFLCVLYCGTALAGNIDCVKFLRIGDKKICMKVLKDTSPSLAVEIDNGVYYASTVPEKNGGIRFQYKGYDYSVYNRDDTEYELIHWLSGNDELVNGVWMDRLADTTSDTGPMNFVNNRCVWNDEHSGYYSADGWKQFFMTSDTPNLDFGTDWYAEVVAKVGEPLGTSCYPVDFSALLNASFGTGLSISNRTDNDYFIGRINLNAKYKFDGIGVKTGDVAYTWDTKALFVFGVTRYSINQSHAFITWDGNQYYGALFNTMQWNQWSSRFFLFRGFAATWVDTKGFSNRYQCGPTTIYDIKIWRKKL